jgi:hypothetical protein
MSTMMVDLDLLSQGHFIHTLVIVTQYLKSHFCCTPEIFTDDSSWKEQVQGLLWVTLTLFQGHQVKDKFYIQQAIS